MSAIFVPRQFINNLSRLPHQRAFSSLRPRFNRPEFLAARSGVFERNSLSLVLKGVGISGIAIGLSTFAKPDIIHGESWTVPPTRTISPPPPLAFQQPLPPPPISSVNAYELGFGLTCGVCAGVFVKKGAKALAFVFGGLFVFLQYLNSTSMIRVDWVQISSRFERHIASTPGPDGKRKLPTLYTLWNALVRFLVADFQQRASFIAGFALGLRVG